MKINKEWLKGFAKRAAIQVAESACMVAIDQSVRVWVNSKLKPYFAKKQEQQTTQK